MELPADFLSLGRGSVNFSNPLYYFLFFFKDFILLGL